MRTKGAGVWPESLRLARPARVRRVLSRDRLKNLLLVLASVAITVLAIEAVGHALGKRLFIPFRLDPRDMSAHYFVPDKAMGFDIAKNFRDGQHTFADGTFPIFSNEYGCFDTDAPVPSDYVLMIGDSFTWGYGPFEHKWGTVLEKLLGRRVVKCGMPATGTHQHLQKGREVVSLIGHSPSLIVLGYYWNDFDDDFAFPPVGVLEGYLTLLVKGVDVRTGEVLRYTDAELRHKRREKLAHERPGLRKFIRDNSVTANLVVRGARALRELVTPPPPVRSVVTEHSVWESLANDVEWAEEAWRRHQQNLLDVREFAEAHGARLLVVIIPDKEIVYADPLRRFFESRHFSYYDLAVDMRAFSGAENFDELYWQTDRHWNVIGNELAGTLTARRVVDAGLLANLPRDLSGAIEARLKEIKAELND